MSETNKDLIIEINRALLNENVFLHDGVLDAAFTNMDLRMITDVQSYAYKVKAMMCDMRSYNAEVSMATNIMEFCRGVADEMIQRYKDGRRSAISNWPTRRLTRIDHVVDDEYQLTHYDEEGNVEGHETIYELDIHDAIQTVCLHQADLLDLGAKTLVESYQITEISG